jgi:hypothetical protein
MWTLTRKFAFGVGENGGSVKPENPRHPGLNVYLTYRGRKVRGATPPVGYWCRLTKEKAETRVSVDCKCNNAGTRKQT